MICSKCKIEKDVEEFNKNKKKCRSCEKDIRKAYREKNLEKLRQQEIDSYYRNYDSKKKYRNENIENKSTYNKKYYNSNCNREKERVKIYYKENKNKVDEKSKIYRKNNIDKVKKWKFNFYLSKKDDPLFIITQRIRNRIRKAIKGQKSQITENILGCKFTEFKIYIESQFKEGMSWENHGNWHLDHKIPISWATNLEDIIKLSHFSNFQPLWAFENLEKGNKRSD